MSDLLERVHRALGQTYHVEREIGHGGMAFVFLARDLKHDRPVAIKVLRPELSASLGTGRFMREIEIASRLTHPHILPLLDSGEVDSLLYFVMPFFEGESLRDRLLREHQLPIGDAVRIAEQVANALGYAHAHGVVHRDIKPENIMLAGGAAMVADFGVARAVSSAGGDKLTETGMAVGTPAYMSPEQATAAPDLDARSDIYSLGCVLYEMLVGEPPFTGRSAQAIMARRLNDPVPSIRTVREGVPDLVEAVARKALARAPADRYATAAEFGEALRQAVTTPVPGLAATAAGWGVVPRRARRVAAGVAAVLLILAAGYVALARRGGGVPGGGTGRGRSIAVLPFASLSADPNDEYFSDGMAEELITALGKVPGLKVVPRTSAFAFKGKSVTSGDIGRSLAVNQLVEGTVRRSGNRVRVTARLVLATSDSVLWTDEYERDIRDVFAVQDEIARAIMGALEVHLIGGASAPVVTRATESPGAYDRYLRGRYFFGQRTGEGLRKAVDLFQQAIGLDSSFAAAYSGLSDAYTLQALFGYVTPLEGMAQAQQAARRALALDSSLSEAQTSLGLVKLWRDWDLTGAARDLSHAVALDSGNTTAHLFLAWDNLAMGRPAEALREAQIARQIDPLSVILNTRVASMWYYSRQYDRALVELRRSFELDSTNALAHAVLARIYVAQHRCPEALAQVPAIPATLPNFEEGIRGYILARCGRRQEALAVLRDVREQSSRGFVMATKVALVYAGLDDRPNMLAWLERGASQREWPILVLDVDPLWEDFKSDPRFRTLARLER